ncbi:hypothetical protein HY345_02875 [Candidatus Microgenomates bacterium]|nr:hypothetical protein [Candidatus Microgenomates bacterium]
MSSLESLQINGELPSHLQETRKLLAERNLLIFTPNEIQTSANLFAHNLTLGLQTDGREGFPMLNSHVRRIDLTNLPVGKEVLVMVVGGTFVRAYSVENAQNGLRIKGDIESRQEYRTDIKIGDGRVATSAAQFCNKMLDTIGAFLENWQPAGAVTLYAFAATPTVRNGNLDVIPFKTMGKGFAVPDIADRPFGEVFYDQPLTRQLTTPHKIVVNDVPALGTAGDAKICCFNSSGVNVGVLLNGVWCITECGGAFRDLPKNAYLIRLDEESNNPGHGLLEKQLTSPYMLETFKLAMRDLAENGIVVGISTRDDLTVVNFSSIANGTDHLLTQVDKKTADVMTVVARTLAYRSAQANGLILGATIKTFLSEFPEEEVLIPLQSKVAYAIRGYTALATAIASEVSSKKVKFLNIPDADILGAAAIVLSKIPAN